MRLWKNYLSPLKLPGHSSPLSLSSLPGLLFTKGEAALRSKLLYVYTSTCLKFIIVLFPAFRMNQP